MAVPKYRKKKNKQTNKNRKASSRKQNKHRTYCLYP